MTQSPNISKLGIDLSVCMYCKKAVTVFDRTTDHLFPKSKGGKLSNDNKVPSCPDCNQLKGDMNVVEFEQFLDASIRFEHMEHKKRIGHLKKVKMNVSTVISNFNVKKL